MHLTYSGQQESTYTDAKERDCWLFYLNINQGKGTLLF